MTDDQLKALQGLVGRDLTSDEVAQLDPLVEMRNDMAIDDLLSVGRTHYGITQIGAGTIVAIMGDPRSGEFLDAVENLGVTDRTVYWGFDPVRRGVLDLSVPAAVGLLITLQVKLPDYADDIAKLLAFGRVASPFGHAVISAALNKAEGRMTL